MRVSEIKLVFSDWDDTPKVSLVMVETRQHEFETKAMLGTNATVNADLLKYLESSGAALARALRSG